MELKLLRRFKENQRTFGKLFADDVFLCYTLEDVVRDKNADGDLDDGPEEAKVYAQTAIPYGTYPVVISYSPKFKKNLPEVQNVKHFTGIRIHTGNSIDDTAGCILPGKEIAGDRVLRSTEAFNELFQLIEKAIGMGEEVTLTVTDE